MKVLVLGVDGMLGHQVYLKALQELGSTNVYGTNRTNFDFNNTTTYDDVIELISGFDGVINCLGLTKPRCVDPETSFVSNTKLPYLFGRACEDLGIKFLHMSTDCFTGDTKVLTENGYKEIKNIKIGDYVYTHKGNLRRVYDLVEKPNLLRELFELKFYGSKPIKCTRNHPFYIVKHKSREKVDLSKKEWVIAEDLNINDLIIVPKLVFNEQLKNTINLNKYLNDPQKLKNIEYEQVINLNLKYKNEKYFLKKISNELNIPYRRVQGWIKGYYRPKNNQIGSINFSEDLFWLFGAYVAEGWSHDSSGAVYFCYGDEPKLIRKTQRIIKNIFGLGSTIKKLSGQKGSHVIVYNTALKNLFLSWFYNSKNKYSHTKTFPNWFLNLNNKFKGAFIKGYFDGDGCHHKSKIRNTEIISFNSVSEDLIDKLKIMLNSLNILGGVSIKNPFNTKIGGRILNGKKSYTLTISGLQINLLKKLLCLDSNKVTVYNKFFEDKYNFYLPLRNIVLKESDELVYNLEVEEDHSYLVDGMLSVHNCVYDGFEGPYSEVHPFSPDDLYSWSKVGGDLSLKTFKNTIIVRSSIIGQEFSNHKSGLLEWFLSQEGKVKGYTNHVWSGFTTNLMGLLLVKLMLYMLSDDKLTGTFVFSSGAVSKYNLLGLIKSVWEREVEVEPVETNVSIDRSLWSVNFDELPEEIKVLLNTVLRSQLEQARLEWE